MNKSLLFFRTTSVGKELVISAELLQSVGVKKEIIRVSLLQNKLSWQGSIETGILYEPLMQRYKERICAHLGVEASELYAYTEAYEAKQAAEAKAKRYTVIQEALAKYQLAFADWVQVQNHYKRTAPKGKAETYARTYLLFRYVMQLDKAELIRLGFATKSEAYQHVSELVEIEQLPASFGSEQTIRRKLREAEKTINPDHFYVLAIDQRTKATRGNQKIRTTEQQNLLISLLASPAKPSPMQAAIVYNKAAAQQGWEAIIERTVERFWEKHRVKIALNRDGAEVVRNQFDTNVLRRRPAAPDMLWIMDGTPIDVAAKEIRHVYKPETGKTNKYERTFRLYLFVVIDACTWEVLGWNISNTENHTAVASALASAIRNTGKRPQQLMYDNASANKTLTPILDRIAQYNTPTAPYAPNSKTVEPFLKVWKHECERFMEGWVGLGIRSKTDSNRGNAEHLYEIRNQLCTPQELQVLAEQNIKYWNNERADRTGRIPAMLRLKTPSVGVPTDMETAMHIFSQVREKTYKYYKHGIEFVVEAQKVCYALPPETDDYARLHLELVGRQWQVQYDPTCAEFIYLYQNDRPYTYNGSVVMLMKMEKMAMAIADYGVGEGAKIQTHHKNKAAIKQELETQRVRTQALIIENKAAELLNPTSKTSYNQTESECLFNEVGYIPDSEEVAALDWDAEREEINQRIKNEDDFYANFRPSDDDDN